MPMKVGLSDYFRLEVEIAGATVFLPGGSGRKCGPGEIKPTTYGALEAMKEILHEGAKNFAPLSKRPAAMSIVVTAVHARMLYIKASQLVGEGLATKP